MGENKYKEEEKEPVAIPQPAPPKKQPAFMSGLNMSAFYLFENIHFIFYVAFLGIIYIANSHYAVNTIKDIKVLQQELKEMRSESNSRKSSLMYQSMESVVERKVHHLGLKELSGHPKKIIEKEAE